jgi:hypothetical protein
MLSPSTEYQLRLTEVRFATSLALGNYTARLRGFLKPHSAGSVHNFTLTANYAVGKGMWGIDLRNVRWTSPVARSMFDFRNVENLCKVALEAFRLLWIQPVPGANEGGAQLRVGHTLMTEEQGCNAFSILRSDILGLYRLDWPKLWPAIENRLMHDPEFWVSGFTRQDAVDAATILKSVFPWEWVRRRYRDSAKKPTEVGMWDVMQADQGFPAYLLARTAIGCVCKDPGWNYLITLAKSCKLLKGFPKGSSLLQRIAKEPGHIHQANFSEFLLQRGLLAAVEPTTGSGNAKHDMTVRAGDLALDIEMKALTSSDPARQVTREIADKCRKIPSSLPRPLVFFVLLVETSITSNHQSRPDQLNSINSDVFGQTTGVSCVVVGRIFVDSAGGPIKWGFDKFVFNEHAHHRVDEPLIRTIFEPNWQRLIYPLMPIIFTYNPTESGDKKC